MKPDRLKEIVGLLARDTEALQLYKREPEAFAKKFRFDDDELRGLKGADLLLVKTRGSSNAGTATATFDTGTTITARSGVTSA
jgi:hypothetical protein